MESEEIVVRSYSEQKGFVSMRELALLQLVREKTSKLQDRLPSGRYFSCHVLCRAFASAFSLGLKGCQDGYFLYPGWTHSWLITSEDNILDLYPWAQVGGPVLLCTKYFSPWKHAFIKAKLNGLETLEFLEDVKITAKLFREIV